MATAPITLRCSSEGDGWLIEAPGHNAGTVTSRRLDRSVAAARPLLERICGPDVDIDDVDVTIEVVAAPPVAAAVRLAIDARDQAADLQDEASQAMRDAVHVLVTEQAISLRDAGSLLGLSYERVRQLHAEPSHGAASRPGGTVVPVISADELG